MLRICMESNILEDFSRWTCLMYRGTRVTYRCEPTYYKWRCPKLGWFVVHALRCDLWRTYMALREHHTPVHKHNRTRCCTALCPRCSIGLFSSPTTLRDVQPHRHARNDRQLPAPSVAWHPVLGSWHNRVHVMDRDGCAPGCIGTVGCPYLHFRTAVGCLSCVDSAGWALGSPGLGRSGYYPVLQSFCAAFKGFELI